MGKIIKIKNNDIENILLEVSRQYLVGNLKRPQKLDFINKIRVFGLDFCAYIVFFSIQKKSPFLNSYSIPVSISKYFVHPESIY